MTDFEIKLALIRHTLLCVLYLGLFAVGSYAMLLHAITP